MRNWQRGRHRPWKHEDEVLTELCSQSTGGELCSLPCCHSAPQQSPNYHCLKPRIFISTPNPQIILINNYKSCCSAIAAITFRSVLCPCVPAPLSFLSIPDLQLPLPPWKWKEFLVGMFQPEIFPVGRPQFQGSPSARCGSINNPWNYTENSCANSIIHSWDCLGSWIKTH